MSLCQLLKLNDDDDDDDNEYDGYGIRNFISKAIPEILEKVTENCNTLQLKDAQGRASRSLL